MFRILVTAPPVVNSSHRYDELFETNGMIPTFLNSPQLVPKSELVDQLPKYDGWILGDDICDREVLQAGLSGSLKAAIRWGAGFDNVDHQAVKEFGFPIENTPGTFATEVADIAIGYLIGLVRQIPAVHTAILDGRWVKPVGTSLNGKTVGVVGLGVIGIAICERLQVMGMKIIGYDPARTEPAVEGQILSTWPSRLEELDFLILCCPLTTENQHMINSESLRRVKRGVRIINVARGGLINEQDLMNALDSGFVSSVALDVYEVEPLGDSKLLTYPQNIYGSHNASNTSEAVDRTTEVAVAKLASMLGAINEFK